MNWNVIIVSKSILSSFPKWFSKTSWHYHAVFETWLDTKYLKKKRLDTFRSAVSGYKDAERFISQSISQTIGEFSRLHSFLQLLGVRGAKISYHSFLKLRMTLFKKKSICTCYRVMFKAANLHSEELWNCQANPVVISWISSLEPS